MKTVLAAPKAKRLSMPIPRRLAAGLAWQGTRIVVSLIFVIPFAWMLLTSLRVPDTAMRSVASWLPSQVTLGNYPRLFEVAPMATYLLNSLKITSLVVIGRLFFCSLAGYAFARLEFPGKRIAFAFLIGAMLLPILIAIIPLYLVYRQIGWLDTHWPLIVPPMLTSSFGVFWMRQFFLTVPRDLEDAAKIDGCGIWSIYWRVMLPLSKAHLAALGVLTFISSWNEFFTPLIFLSSREMYTVPLGLSFFSGSYGTNYPLLMAASFLAILPILAIYLVAQRQIIEGMMRSGLK